MELGDDVAERADVDFVGARMRFEKNLRGGDLLDEDYAVARLEIRQYDEAFGVRSRRPEST